jgi:hypothetical protein
MVLQGYNQESQSQSKMGQCASKRAASKRAASKQCELNKSIKELSSKKVWMMVKIEEFEALQNSASESQKDIDKMRKQFLCQSTILKEIIDDMLKLQNNENEKLKERVQKLETAFAASASSLAQSSFTLAATTVAEK